MGLILTNDPIVMDAEGESPCQLLGDSSYINPDVGVDIFALSGQPPLTPNPNTTYPNAQAEYESTLRVNWGSIVDFRSFDDFGFGAQGAGRAAFEFPVTLQCDVLFRVDPDAHLVMFSDEDFSVSVKTPALDLPGGFLELSKNPDIHDCAPNEDTTGSSGSFTMSGYIYGFDPFTFQNPHGTHVITLYHYAMIPSIIGLPEIYYVTEEVDLDFSVKAYDIPTDTHYPCKYGELGCEYVSGDEDAASVALVGTSSRGSSYTDSDGKCELRVTPGAEFGSVTYKVYMVHEEINHRNITVHNSLDLRFTGPAAEQINYGTSQLVYTLSGDGNVANRTFRVTPSSSDVFVREETGTDYTTGTNGSFTVNVAAGSQLGNDSYTLKYVTNPGQSNEVVWDCLNAVTLVMNRDYEFTSQQNGTTLHITDNTNPVGVMAKLTQYTHNDRGYAGYALNVDGLGPCTKPADQNPCVTDANGVAEVPVTEGSIDCTDNATLKIAEDYVDTELYVSIENTLASFSVSPTSLYFDRDNLSLNVELTVASRAENGNPYPNYAYECLIPQDENDVALVGVGEGTSTNTNGEGVAHIVFEAGANGTGNIRFRSPYHTDKYIDLPIEVAVYEESLIGGEGGDPLS